MNTKRMITNAILIAIGVILHQLTPALGLPMQPDFALAMLFIIIVYNKEYKTTIICGLIVGIFTALTSKTPGGQLPNLADKFITCNIMYLMLMPLRKRVGMNIQIMMLLSVGTLVSGTIFLTVLMLTAGLPGGASFGILFMAVVLPTTVLNAFAGYVVYKIVARTVITTKAYA
ncbi:tryptophan transporter [Clostridium botulinum]|uniref:tryptophan transporter n=1 Tax=Clostridium botulinum TaxID=1491 RepID=UPI00144F9C35|nr:tryptophan transporter [Clostridium botulinum]MBN1041116.1 tryptophan transporter [Clostridium botulinum]MBN1063964.1 tryptophan transporter [Clostridium botulinum]NFO04434.1 tryptophan transporter [Clostridium botulinum]UZP04074.1 tryptophan transporter [Clostridium botulinum]UZP07431.1 tryptophan transporter [Clostridium botulinum]